MCITRVGKVLSVEKSRARVKIVADDRILENIDVSMINPVPNSYIEVYANLGMSVLTAEQARQRKRLWNEVSQKARN
jgi:hydrogenase maturation factor